MLERNLESYHNIPLDYRAADEVLSFCSKNGLAFFPYSPLFQGLLAGTFKPEGNFDENDVRAANPKLVDDTFKTYFEVVEKLNNLARRIGKPLSQIAINWLVNQPEVTSVICGAQNPQHIEENVASISWELTDEILNQLDEIIAPYQQAGII